MFKRKNVAVLVRTADFESFRNTEQENFKTAFLEDDGTYDDLTNVENYNANLVYKNKTTGELINERADLTLVTIKDVAWTKRLKWTKAVLKFLESLNYYELSIVNDDNNATEYFADDYTKQFPNDGYLRSDVEFRVA